MNIVTALIKEIRVYQWVKNSLIFTPLLLSHTFSDSARFMDSVIAFFAFNLCASAVYVINDLCDIESDRKHPEKKFRPVAANIISVNFARIITLILVITSFAIAFTLNREFVLVLLGYFLLTLFYSFGLKKVAIVDVIILGGLYTLRIIAGVVVIRVEISYWLIIFSLFIFISLAILKRYIELFNMKARNEMDMSHRGYKVEDITILSRMGITASNIAILVVALYIHDPLVITKYTSPIWLWFIIPALFYWLSRIWLLANRGELHEDPILFALHDMESYVVAFICILSVVLAI